MGVDVGFEGGFDQGDKKVKKCQKHKKSKVIDLDKGYLDL